MAQRFNIVSPYSVGYTSEREFFINILVNGEPLPKEELQQLHTLSLDLHEDKPAVGVIKIGTSAGADAIFGTRVSNHEYWNAGKKLTIFAGPVEDVVVFGNLYIKKVSYVFDKEGVIATIKLRDTSERMKRRQRQRRFNRMNAGKLIQMVASRYKLTPVMDLQGEETKIVFDENFNFSQTNQNDAEMLDQLCTRLGWKWRVNGGNMELYHAYTDENKPPTYAYQLDFRTGECSLDSFKVKVNYVDVPQHYEKPKRKAFSGRIRAGKKKSLLGGSGTLSGAAYVLRTYAHRGFSGGSKKIVTDITRAFKNNPSLWNAVSSNSGPRLFAKESLGTLAAGLAPTQKYITEGGKLNPDKNTPLPSEVVIKKPRLIGRQRETWISGEAVLAFPTLRIQPRVWASVACGGSSFFSRLYKCKRMKLQVDGKRGSVKVGLFLGVHAWTKQYKIDVAKLRKPWEHWDKKVTKANLSYLRSPKSSGLAVDYFKGIKSDALAKKDLRRSPGEAPSTGLDGKKEK